MVKVQKDKSRIDRGSKSGHTLFQKFGLYFYARTKLVIFMWVALVGFGLLAYTTLMQRQGFPNVSIPISTVQAGYFVQDRDKVDQTVTRPLNEIIKQVDGVKSVDSKTGENFATFVIEYDDSIGSEEGSDLVEKAVKNANKLPSDVKLNFAPIDAAKYNGEFDLLVSVYDENEQDLRSLQTRAESLPPILESIEGVESAKVIVSFETSTNPITGSNQTIQNLFDRFGKVDGEDIIFYQTINVGVVYKPGADLIEVSQRVEEKLSTISGKDDIKALTVSISSDFAPAIEEQTTSLQRNLLEGLLVIVIVSLLLISFRAGLAIALGMISTLLITIGVLYLAGITLNTISLFALVLCLGLIVDDVTIMIEAIDAMKQKSTKKRDVVAHALKRVARASTAGTLTTILAFAPMLFISGILGEFIRVLPITIIISLVVSLFVSLTIVPTFSKLFILGKEHGAGKKARNPIARFEQYASLKLANIIRIGKKSRSRLAVIGVSAIVLSFVAIGVGLNYFGKLTFDIFPSPKDGNEIQISFKFDPDTSIEQAQEIVDEANEVLAEVLGENFKQLTYSSSATNMTATATGLLVPYGERDVTSTQLSSEAQDQLSNIGGAEIKVATLGAGPPANDLPFAVQIYSEDSESAATLAQTIKNELDGSELTLPNGDVVKVTKVQISEPNSITRRDGRRYLELRAGFDSKDVSGPVIAAQSKIEKAYSAQRLITEFNLEADALEFDSGSESDNQESFASMLIAFPILLLAMYILLVVQFRSLLQPILIFFALPFSFLGVGMGLYYTNNSLSFFAMLGFFALIGIAVNNTILLTDYANQARKEGMGRIEAIATALQARFRPLITTSLTSVVALIPLALQDPFWQSLSVTLIFGLLSSTLLVVLVFPYYLLAGESVRAGGRLIWRKAFRH